MMKKYLLLALSLLALNSWAKPLVVATDGGYPPFSQIADNGELTGFDIEISKALCKEMNKECEVRQLDWEALIPALQNEQIDAIIASMNATEERKQSIDFTDKYYSNPGIFVRKKGSNIEISQEGLKGKTIGVLSATVFDYYASDKFKDWGVKIDRYSNQEDAILDAQKGVVDVLFADEFVLDNGFLQKENGANFEQFGDKIDDPKYFGSGISIGIRKEDQKLKEEFNQAIKGIREKNIYQEISNKYFSKDIYGE